MKRAAPNSLIPASSARRMGPKPPPAIRWVGGLRGHLSLLDQTALPHRVVRVAVRNPRELWKAIRRLAVRGAPAIGVAAAYGVVLGAQSALRGSCGGPKALREFRTRAKSAIEVLATSRPTAVNLFWALHRMGHRIDEIAPEDLAREFDARRAVAELLEEARKIHREDEELCRAIGRHGQKLLRDGWTVLTHCNAGALATGGSGTALAVVYEASRSGKTIRVFSDETRPLLQGARLTSWELLVSGIDVTLIADGAAASALASGKVQAVVVGADRIASNGDVANKIGTLGVAVAARRYGVPFYVAAPSTTFDLRLRDGSEIPIEERAPEEVLEILGRRAAPRGVGAWNPAFDVTPAELITAIITEKGVLKPPYRRSIARVIGTRNERAKLSGAPIHERRYQ